MRKEKIITNKRKRSEEETPKYFTFNLLEKQKKKQPKLLNVTQVLNTQLDQILFNRYTYAKMEQIPKNASISSSTILIQHS